MRWLVTAALAVMLSLQVAAGLWSPAAIAGELPAAASLREELRRLAAEHDFRLRGSGQIEETARAEAGAGDLRSRLRALLGGYNYVMRQGPGGKVTELNILGPRPAAASGLEAFTIATTRIGRHYLVQATLTGPTGRRTRQPLILDTGATSIVLPTSMIPLLGFLDGDLQDGWAETAGGRRRTRVGRLAQVTVGRATRRNVRVAFIADEFIGDKALLGMSFLDHYEITLRPSENRLLLFRR